MFGTGMDCWLFKKEVRIVIELYCQKVFFNENKHGKSKTHLCFCYNSVLVVMVTVVALTLVYLEYLFSVSFESLVRVTSMV